MPAFLVAASPSPVSRVNDSDMAVIFAADAADAKALAQARFQGDGNASWGAATVTQIIADPNLEGWRLRVRVCPPAGGTDLVDVTYTGVASDAPDDMGDGMVLLLNALASIANASYTSATQVLIIAEGASDALGDHTVLVELLPPLALSADPVAIPGFISAGPTHEGASSADLNVTFAADAYVVPFLLATGRNTT